MPTGDRLEMLTARLALMEQFGQAVRREAEGGDPVELPAGFGRALAGAIMADAAVQYLNQGRTGLVDAVNKARQRLGV